MIDPRNRIALSKQVMRALDVSAGDYVTFDVNDAGHVRILKLNIVVASAKRPSGKPD